jgi:hypothetical protein
MKHVTTVRVICALFFVMIYAACKHDPFPAPAPPSQVPVSGGSQVCSPDTVYFQNKVLPMIISNCAKSGCHDAASRQKGVILTSYASIMSTAGVRSGDASGSKIYKMITETDVDKRMPLRPNPALSAAQIQLVYTWIMQGAKNNACQDCDTAGTIRYSIHILPLLQNHCTGCHSGASPAAGLDLTIYNNVRTVALNGKLRGVTTWATGFPQMPRGGAKLSDCKQELIRKWIAAGATNN